MTQLLARLASLAGRHPWRLILLASLPALGLSLYALRVPLDLSFTGIMNRSNPEVARYFDTSERYELGGQLLLLLEGPEASLDDASARVLPVLQADPSVREVFADDAAAWLEPRLPWLVERPVFDAWIRLATHPTDEVNGRWLGERLERLARDERAQIPGVRVLQIRMHRDPLAVDVGGSAFFALESQVDQALAESPARASFSGLPAIAAQDQARTLGTIERLSPISLLAVLLLFHFIERRWLNLTAAVVPLLLAVGGTVGLVGLLLGELTVMETFFGVTVFGLGIDFAIHLIVRQREERARGKEFDSALQTTLPGTGRGVVAGAFTTAGAFFIVALAPDPVAVHLGLSGGLGLLACLLLMLTLMPPFWVLLERRRASRHPAKSAAAALPIPVVPQLARHAVRHPALHLSLALLLLVAALAGTPRFHTETDLEHVFNRQVPALETTRRIQQLFDLNGAPWIVGVPDLDAARRLAARFAADPAFARVDSLASLLPADLEARVAQLAAHRDTVAAALELAGSLAGYVPEERKEELEALQEGLRRLQTADRLGPPSLDSLPPSLTAKLRAANGDFLLYAYATGSALDGATARAQRLAAQAIAPSATGLGALLEAAMLGERQWIWPVASGILAFVAFILLLDMRQLRLALLALVPVVLGVGITFGALCWLDVGFNVMTSFVVPLIIGLGVDDGIHVVHRLRERVDPSVDAAAAAVGRAIVMTTVTTSSSFAVLLLTDHPGLESMGLVMLIGLPICLLASVTTLPALAVLLYGRRTLAPPVAA